MKNKLLKDKHFNFLMSNINFLEDELKSREKVDFLENIITFFNTEEELTSSKLVEIDCSKKERTTRTYVVWLDSFIKLIGDNKERLWANESAQGLDRFPIIRKKAGQGGAGNETTYYVDFLNLNELASDSNNVISAKDNHDFNKVKYFAKKLKRTPWYLKLCNPFFQNINYRRFLIIVLFLYFWLLPGWLGWSFATNSSPSLLVWSCLFVLYAFTANPIRNIFAIIQRKIVLLSDAFMPISAVCISEISGESKGKKSTEINRTLATVEITANCPICYSKYGIVESIILEKPGLFSHKIIGECLNNPTEHKYTFDKDLMTGERIR